MKTNKISSLLQRVILIAVSVLCRPDSIFAQTPIASYAFNSSYSDNSGYANTFNSIGIGSSFVTDRFGNGFRALSFNGTTQAYLYAPTSTSFQSMSTMGTSVSVWVKPTSAAVTSPSNRTIWTIIDDNNVSYDLLYLYSSNQFAMNNFPGFGASTSNILEISGTYAPSEWHHVVLVFDPINSTSKMYIDNSLVKTVNKAIDVPTVNTILGVGNHKVNPWNYNGLMDDVKVYNKPLSASEVDQLYQEGIIASYTFDNSYSDQTAYSNDFNSMGTGTSFVTDRFGNSQKALSFNGTTQAYLYAPTSASFQSMSTLGTSVSVWVKPTSAAVTSPSNRTIWTIIDDNNVSYDLLYLYSSNQFAMNNFPGFGASTSNILEISGTYAPSEWHHVVLVFDPINSTSKMYIDNSLVKTVNKAIDVPTVNTILGVGNHKVNPWNYNGLMDDVKVYNKALSIDEIDRLYKRNMPVAFYPFRNNHLDASGNSNNPASIGSAMPFSFVPDRSSNSNEATYFDGSSNAFLYVPSSPSLNLLSSGATSISVWVKPYSFPGATATTTICMISQGGPIFLPPNPKTYELRYNYSTGDFHVRNMDGTTTNISMSAGLSILPNTWHHVVVTFDPANAQTKLYVNNVLRSTVNNSIIIPTSPVVSIGDHVSGGSNFYGAMDALRIHNSVLTVGEINQYYGSTLNKRATGIEDHENTSAAWNIFPNPVADKITIRYIEGPGSLKDIVIYNQIGEVVKQFTPTHSETTFDISTLIPGIYFINGRDAAGQILVKKIMKQ